MRLSKIITFMRASIRAPFLFNRKLAGITLLILAGLLQITLVGCANKAQPRESAEGRNHQAKMEKTSRGVSQVGCSRQAQSATVKVVDKRTEKRLGQAKRHCWKSPAVPACPGGARSYPVSVQGEALIANGTIEDARSRALAKARFEAIARAWQAHVDTQVEPSSLLRLQMLANKGETWKGFSTLVNEQVENTRIADASKYRVQLSSFVCLDRPDLITQLVRSDIVAITVAEFNLGRYSAPSNLTDKLPHHLKQSGYRRILVRAVVNSFEQDVAAWARITSRRQLAGLVIVGSVKSKPLNRPRPGQYAATAGGWVLLYDGRKGAVTRKVRVEGVQGQGATIKKAGKQALDRAGEKLIQKVMKAISPRSLHQITVQVDGQSDQHQLRRLEQTLDLSPWVHKVKRGTSGRGFIIYEVKLAAPASELAAFLSRLPEYRASMITDKTMVVKFTR